MREFGSEFHFAILEQGYFKSLASRFQSTFFYVREEKHWLMLLKH